MKTGWLKKSGKRYYFKKNGKMVTGWLTKKGSRYYFNKTGVMQTGTLKKKKYVYLFDESGKLTAKYTAGEYQGTQQKTKTKASSLVGLTPAEVVEATGEMFTRDEMNSGILACVSMAQFLLESGYGQSELAVKANNCFGMKESLSGNTWPGSTWNGKSVYKKKTLEEGSSGYYTIVANFRKYSCIEDSIADHSAYLANAMDDFGLRYAGLKNCRSYLAAAKIILSGGYATDSTYVAKLASLIKKYDLTRFDAANQ